MPEVERVIVVDGEYLSGERGKGIDFVIDGQTKVVSIVSNNQKDTVVIITGVNFLVCDWQLGG